VSRKLGAIHDNAFTLKRLAREKGRLVLKPENKACPVLRPEGSPLGGRPKEDAEIYGVVVELVRKYK
jgi:repressor LexA